MKVGPETEITLEANPGTFEIERFRGFRAAGVSRLSIGAQSFDDASLAAIGRVHGSGEARRAIEAALSIFPTVNVDLMYALPGQRLEGALRDVETAVALGAPHVCAYHLTLEPNTHFARFPPPLPDHDLAADMQEAIEAQLAAAGFEHYETSAFARPGQRARHNVNYWTFGDYLGIGAGAHGKLTFRDRIVRTERERKPRSYMQAATAGRAESLRRDVANDELPFEFMLNALRLIEGFPATLFSERTGLPLSVVEPQLRAAEAAGLLEADAMHVRPTARGSRFLNDLLATFLGPAPRRPVIPISTCPPGTPRPS
jgi:oxygen-independent coproporphyrinogen-3 oxidase